MDMMSLTVDTNGGATYLENWSTCTLVVPRPVLTWGAMRTALVGLLEMVEELIRRVDGSLEKARKIPKKKNKKTKNIKDKKNLSEAKKTEIKMIQSHLILEEYTDYLKAHQVNKRQQQYLYLPPWWDEYASQNNQMRILRNTLLPKYIILDICDACFFPGRQNVSAIKTLNKVTSCHFCVPWELEEANAQLE